MSAHATGSAPRGGPDRGLREQHNPAWSVSDAAGVVRQVYACDETQAERYVIERWGVVVIAVWRAGD